MLSLFFPNADALRLALASGIVPAEVARSEIAASEGEPGSIWIRTSAALEKETRAALAHIGVRAFSRPAELPSRRYPCWAAALPLKRHEEDRVDGPVLFELPASRLATVLSELARCDSPVEGYRFAGDRAFVRVARASQYWIERIRDGVDRAIRGFRPAAPDFWVQLGWLHSLAPLDEPSDARMIIVSVADGWHSVEPATWHTPREVFPLLQGRSETGPLAAIAPMHFELRLKHRAESAVERFWLFPGGLEALRPHVDSGDRRSLSDLSAVVLRSSEGSECIALRIPWDGGETVSCPRPFRAFVSHPALKNLMIPAESELAPNLRPSALAAAVGLEPGVTVWLEPTESGLRANRLSKEAFRPLSDWLRHTAPETRRYISVVADEHPFALAGFIVIPEPGPPATPAVPIGLRPRKSAVSPVRVTTRGRLAKWAGRLFAKAHRTADSQSSESDAERVPYTAVPPERTALTRQQRVARRTELEEDLFRSDAPGRVELRWAELAGLYAEAGNAIDASLCWLHAVWTAPHSPDSWFRQLAKVETQVPESGEFHSRRGELVDWIRRGTHPAPQSNPPSAVELKSILAGLESSEDNLPCRMVWLARMALAHFSGGDALQLARGRDRLFARLHRDSALAALDTPSFLRFRGLVGSDRFPLARDWLLRCREPIHRWLKKQHKANRLPWAGLDADIPLTEAYADLMLAWGFSKLGDRTRSRGLADAAEHALRAAAGNGQDAHVHRRIVGLFHREIEAAGGVHPEGATAPGGGEAATLADYAVAKLVAHSRILNRAVPRSEFGAAPLAALLGDDELGTKLSALLERKTPAVDAEVRALADRANADRTAATLPRIILTLLEVVGSSGIAADVLPLAPRALELLPEVLRLRGIDEDETSSYLVRLSHRCIDILCRIGVDHASTLQNLVRTLGRGLDADDGPTREILRSTSSRLFRALSRAGLTVEIRSLLSRWYGVAGNRTEANLSAAIGWYTLGEAERGNRILNDARERLFVEGIADERERTRTALAYAQALAHAPPRLALGRLEELFQRLGPISTDGAASSYFALKPLELIDAAITAIVNEDFSLGPEVRNWLDEDERRVRSRITRDLAAAMEGG